MGERTDELKGNVKEGVGKLAGNRRIEAEGRGEAQGAKARRKTKGALRETGGSVKEAVGDLVDNERMQAEGQADQLKGKAQRSG